MNQHEQILAENLLMEADLLVPYLAFDKTISHLERVQLRHEKHPDGIGFLRFMVYGMADYIRGFGSEVHDGHSESFGNAEKRNSLNPGYPTLQVSSSEEE